MSAQSDSEQGRLHPLAHDLAELLDKVGVPTIRDSAAQTQLSQLAADWKASGGGSTGEGLIRQAVGVVGMVNSAGNAEAAQHRAYRDLVEYKNQLRGLARARSR